LRDASTIVQPEEGDSGSPTPADYAPVGSYGATKTLLNQGLGTVDGGTSALLPLGNKNDPSGFTLFYPEGGPAGERLPLLTWGNGTFCSPTFYEALIDHVVSYGFIVVAANTSNVGTGVEMLKAVDWALAQDKDSTSPIYRRVDAGHIGAFGHSQGGEGTVLVGADSRIHAIAPLSGAPLSGQEEASVKIQCPTFYVTTENDIATPASIETVYGYTLTPTVFGETDGGNHDEYTDIDADPHISGLTSDDGLRVRSAIAAWFDWQLKSKAELRSLFVGQRCGFCLDSNWKKFESKGF
jgi:predicted dienelactone hydrolase